MRIDLHNHTSLGSVCSVISPEDLLAEAKAVGVDGVGITEHDSLASAEAVRRIGRRIGLPVFVGVECSTTEGHVLAFGVTGPFPFDGQPTPLAEFLDWVRSQGGAAIIAHPFRVGGGPGARLAEMGHLFDAVEVVNGHNRIGENAPAIAMAEQLGMPMTAGSDTHEPGRVGQTGTIFDEDLDDEAALADAIRRGACRFMYDADVVRL